MRTVPFKKVLDGIATRLGLDPDTNVQSAEAESWASYVTSQLRYAWEFLDWPEIRKLELRAFRDVYDNAASYGVGSEIYYQPSDAYFICTVLSSGNLPTDTNFWAPLVSVIARVDYAQTGQNVIGDVFGIWLDDPRTNAAPRLVNYFIDAEAIYLPGFSGASRVWIRYRPTCPEFTAKSWSNLTNYVVDDIRYLRDSGECYRALQNSVGQNPASQSTYWTKQEVPYIFAEWLKAAVYADALREDGSTDKAAVEEARAEKLLIREADKIWFQQGQQPTWSAVTS